jgi:hypothetical protein
MSGQQQGSNIGRHRHLAPPVRERRSKDTTLWTLSIEIVGNRVEPANPKPRRSAQLVANKWPFRAMRLPANGCTRVRPLNNSLISRNSRPARSASASNKGRSCHRCSDHGRSLAGRNSASRHHTRSNLGSDRYTKGAGCDALAAKPHPSGRNLEGCYSVADDSPAGNRSHAIVALAGHEPARRRAISTGR